MKLHLFFSLIVFVSFPAVSKAVPSADLVSNLPGINFIPNFRHYSGYLRASSTHLFHYWFTLSQNNPSRDPVVLWLSGGPGCSSVSGLLQELGPFRVSNNGATIYENVYAWNKLANVIFIESPAGVGYSYATDGNITTNDDMTASDNHNALLDFFKNKFPEFRKNDFYITGESYAGVYLPTLAVLLLQDKQNFPTFKGLAVGNPLLSYSTNTNTLFPFLYNHGLISVVDWAWIGTNCCNGNPNNCSYYSLMAKPGACTSKLNGIVSSLSNFQDWNPYNLYFSCYLPSNTGSDGSSKRFGSSKHDIYRRMLTNHLGINVEKIQTQENVGTSKLPLCAQYRNSVTYMNRPDVRAALHIPANLPAWDSCNFNLNAKYYHIQYKDMSPQMKQIVGAGKKVLVYNGDVDTICNVMANQRFTNQLGLQLVKDKYLWTYAHDLPSAAGFVTKYQGLDFVTVRGSGHFVPVTKEREALQMLNNFITNRPYSTGSAINVSPQPLVGGACSQMVLSSQYFNGPVPASSLCGIGGMCVNTPSGAACTCTPGYSGPFCNTYTPVTKSVQIQLCAAYKTPMTTAKGLRFGCPLTYTCVPYQYRCVTTLNCNYPIGYCLPWVHLNTMFPSMGRKLRALEKRMAVKHRKAKIVSHYAVKKSKAQ